MQDTQCCPVWFRRLFVAVMAALCLLLAAFALEQHMLRFQISDLTLKLDTSRQREAKQTYEYGLVSQELPQVLAELERISPLAQEAREKELTLRAERKALRAELKALEAEQAALQAEYDALLAQVQALQDSLDSLHELLTE